MRPAMHRVACLPITLHPQGSDPGGLDRQLRDAAVRHVHLEQPALTHVADATAAPPDPRDARSTNVATIMAAPARPAPDER